MRLSQLAVLGLLSLLALPAFAAKGPPKLLELTDLREELPVQLSDDSWKALKAADRCANTDKNWKRAMEPEQQTGIESLYETLAQPVTCWQTAAKKGEKAGTQFAPLMPYLYAQSRYVEALRAYVYALQAKYTGDLQGACKRSALALQLGADAVKISVGTADVMESVDAKTRLGTLTAEIHGAAALIADEHDKLGCD